MFVQYMYRYMGSMRLVLFPQCDVMLEQYEEVLEDWYKGSQEEDLTTYLCEKHVLKGQDTGNVKLPAVLLHHNLFYNHWTALDIILWLLTE